MLGLLVLSGCAGAQYTTFVQLEPGGPLVVGRVQVLLTSPSTRWYGPEVRFFELMNSTTGERIRVNIASPDDHFVLSLPAGDYRLSRVQINEGPFLAMADVTATFQVNQDVVTYLGTWRFMVDAPRTQRMAVMSAAAEQGEAESQLIARYPGLAGRHIRTVLPSPATAEVRLYEVSPYPRYRYFRRHP